MAASYPSGTKSFSTKNTSDTIAASHVNELQDEVVAIENGLRTGLQHNLIFTDDTYDIGASGATRPRDLFLSRNATIGGTAAITGAITATAGQIIFPAAQNAAAGANTLDDYEEGTYVPTLTNGAVGDGTIAGAYVKVGQIVNVVVVWTLGSTSTITGSLSASLPFTAATSAGQGWFGGGLYNDSGASIYPIQVSIASAGTTLAFFAQAAGGTYLTRAAVDATVPVAFASGDIITISITYRASA